MIPHARRILGQVEHMRAEMRAYATGLKGRIRLLANTAALANFLPQQVCRFLLANPDLSVDLDEQPSSEIVLAIASGRADLGIVADIADLSALQTRLIAEDHLVVLASNTHRLGREPSVTFATVVGEPFVGLSDAALEVHLGERASLLGRQINYRAQVRSVEDVAMLVEAGVGVSILPEVSAAKVLRPGLASVRLAEPWARRELYLCARDFSALTPQAALLARQLVSVADERRPE